MSGAVVTSSGDSHRGFHQCPNVLRDKYMPIIGGDGYGYINYLMSWANTNATLPVRRMKKDLGWSQDKLVRVQRAVLEHCGHFVTHIPGDPKTASQWHLDMERLWAENAMHMAQSYAEKLAQRSVPEIGTPQKVKRKSVPKTGTGGVPEIGTLGVPEIGTFKDNVLNTPEKTSSSVQSDDNDLPDPLPDDDSSAVAGNTKTQNPELTTPHSPEQVEPTLESTKLVQDTGFENVPGAAAGPAAGGGAILNLAPVPRAELEARQPRNPEQMKVLRALMQASSDKRLEHLRTQLGLNTQGRKGIPRALYARLTDEEIIQARVAAQADAAIIPGGFKNAGYYALDAMIGETYSLADLKGERQRNEARGIETVVRNGVNLPQVPKDEPIVDAPKVTIDVGSRWEHKRVPDKIVTVVDVSGGKAELHNGEQLFTYQLGKDYRRVD